MIIDQLFTRPLFEASDPSKLMVSITIQPMSTGGEPANKEFDLTGMFQGSTASQMNQAMDYISKWLESKGLAFNDLRVSYQGHTIGGTNRGAMSPQSDAEREMDAMANQMRAKRPTQNATPALKEGAADPITQFASNAHEEWRRNFDPTGTKPRIKKNSDGTEGDINVPFEKLHPDWKKENLAAGHAAHHAVKHFGRDMEKAAEHVHNEWMKRNPKADYNAAQHVPYDHLSDDEKEKDRVHVRTMMRLMGHQLNEFAPSGDDGEGPDQEEILRRLAAHWWNGTEKQMAKVENTLAAMGWEIGEDDGYDDGGVFVVRAGDEHGRTYTSWSADELDMNEAAPPGARAERMVKHIKQGYAKDGKLTPREKGIAFATAWKAHNAGRVEEGEYQDDYEDEETELCNGCYVRDKEDSSGEIFVMRGDPGDRRVRIEDRHGRGWNIAPYRLTVVDDSDPDIAAYFGDELDEAGVTEAAQGHTIEAHGVRGMDRRTWHKTFRNTDQMIAWAEKHDAEIIGTRDLEQARQGVSGGLMNKIANKVMGAAPEQPKYKVGQRVKYETSPHQPDWKDGGRGVGVITAYKNGHYMINGNPVNHFEIKGVVEQGVAEGLAGYDVHKKSTSNNNSSPELRGITIPGDMKHPGWKEPTWSFQEVAEKLGVSPKELQQLALSIGNFPKKVEGLTSRYGSKAYYPRSEIKRWVNATDIRNIIKSKQDIAEGLTEMDKSEPSAGRDTGPRPGPDREAKPVAAKKATRDAGRMLNRAFRDSHKKKDVKESDTLMLKLKRAMVREGRVKELADDLKTMNDADFMKKYGKAKAAIRKDMKRVDEAPVNELSTNKLAQYKTAAAKDATAADKAGDVKRGDKRFHGMVQATKKQFDNDAKKVDESRAARRALMAQIVNGN